MPLSQSPSLSTSVRARISNRSRTQLLLGLLLLGTGILSSGVGADSSDRENDNRACIASSSCDGPNSTAEAKTYCIADAERGLCASDPKEMFKRCSPDEYCRDREDFGAVVSVKASVFQNAGIVGDCVDHDEDCEFLANDEGQCLLNPYFMQENCRKSCYMCIDKGGVEIVELPIGVKQELPPHVRDLAIKKKFYDVIAETASYMAKEVFVEEELAEARRNCRNTDRFCSWWVASTRGSYCNDSSGKKSCGPACKACAEMILTEDELETVGDCIPDVDTDAFQNSEGENGEQTGNGSKTIDAMFRRIVGELSYPSPPGEQYPIVPGVNYTVKILSRPSLNPKIHKNMSFGSINFLIGGPWIVLLEDFLSPEECDRLIELGDVVGRRRSTIEDEDDDEYDDEDDDDEKEIDIGGNDNGYKNVENDRDSENKNEDTAKEKEETLEEGDGGGKPDAWRTSSTAWCKKTCLEDPIVQRVQQRIGLTTGVTDASYYEELQLLKYIEGQYYHNHHDESGDLHDEKFNTEGPRILTFFLYLNDVEEGGETRFSDLMGDDTNIYLDVAPKRGRALLWPSMLDEDVLAYDTRTFHAALKVKKGVKYGANAWLHLRDVRNNECDEDGIEEVKDKLYGLIS